MPNQVADWIKTQSRPVVILHHETPTAVHYIQRDLANSNSTVTPLTEFQISQYQVSAANVMRFSILQPMRNNLIMLMMILHRSAYGQESAWCSLS